MNYKMMEDFQKQLEKLLLKFPNLPEFTLTVRPRVSIEVGKSKIIQPVYQAPQNTVPHIDVSSPQKVDPADRGLIEEKRINPHMLAEIAKFSHVE